MFAAFDILTEALLFALAFYIIQGLQMSWTKKGSVLVAFGLRLPVIVAIAFRLHYLHVELHASDPTYHGLYPSICTQVEMSYAILAATIPSSRVFIAASSTQAPITSKKKRSYNKYAGGSGSREKSLQKNIALSSLSEKKHSKIANPKNSIPASSEDVSTWPNRDNTASIMSPGDEHSLESNESSRRIIRKDVEWVVNYEEAPTRGDES